jgi:hypothetical protein
VTARDLRAEKLTDRKDEHLDDYCRKLPPTLVFTARVIKQPMHILRGTSTGCQPQGVPTNNSIALERCESRPGGTQQDLGDHLVIASPRICWFMQSRQPGSRPRQRLGDEKIQRSSGGTSFIAMVKSSDLRELYHRAQFRPLDGPRDGRVLGQRKMGARTFVVCEIRPQNATQS